MEKNKTISYTLFTIAFYTHLSASVPNKIFPTKIPDMKIVCEIFAQCSLLQTKLNVEIIVSVNTVRLNSYSVHSGEHFSIE